MKGMYRNNLNPFQWVVPNRNMERERIGNRIKELRNEQNMDAKTLSQRIGIDAANLSRIEKGRFSVGLDILSKIASALNTKLEFIPIEKKDEKSMKNTTKLLNEYTEERTCVYKGERYSVRDNGSVLRHQREGKKERPLDNKWTFGNIIKNKGYCYICNEPVHRIVAWAFHGEPEIQTLVVDHRDTNRQNNRPENLKWVSRVENILENPITRARIELVCGSIENFLNDPTLLSGHESKDPSFSWMRTVSKEEAQFCLKRNLQWADNPKIKGGSKGEWMYTSIQNKSIINRKVDYKYEEINDKSLTPNAKQISWKIKTEFPCCPQVISENPILDYNSNLCKGNDFCKNGIYSSKVLEFAKINDELVVLTYSGKEAVKPWGLCRIEYKDGFFYHYNEGSFFKEDGGYKYFTLAQNKEWTGGEVFDDFCR